MKYTLPIIPIQTYTTTQSTPNDCENHGIGHTASVMVFVALTVILIKVVRSN